MAKFNAKNLALFIFLGILLVGVIGIVSAQEALPRGGDSFETAVKLEPGSYEGGEIESVESEYFYINVKAGQELQMKGILKALSDSSGNRILGLYDEDRKEVAYTYPYLFKGEEESFSFSWLSNSEKDLYKYYIKRESNGKKIGPLSFDLSLIDHYDAGSQTDAGDDFEKPISITSGEYTAYLSARMGTDTKDFYKLAVKKGATLTVKVTPPSEAAMTVVVYDSNRAVLKSEWAANPGAIVTNSVPITKSEDVFVAVICDKYCSDNLVAYTLNISTEGVPAEEVEEGVPPGAEEGVPKGVAAEGLNWVLILGIIAILIILGILAYFLLKRKKQESPKRKNNNSSPI